MKEIEECNSIVHKGPGKKAKIIICTVLITIICLMCFFKCKKSNTDIIGTDEVLSGKIPNMTQEELKTELKKKQDAATFDVQLNSGGTIDINSNKLNLNVSNPESNLCDCYFEILDNQEVIYKSPVMAPKSYMQTESISKVFNKKGNYKLEVKYTFLYKEKPAGQASIEVIISCK